MLKKSLATLSLLITLAFVAAAQTSYASKTNADGKIPVTSSSEEAKKEYLMGRDLAEKLLIQDSIQHYDKAIELDSSFALAELNRANSSPTAREFFEHLNKAVSLADKASAGERLLILVHNFYKQAGGEDVVFRSEGLLLRQHGHEVIEY